MSKFILPATPRPERNRSDFPREARLRKSWEYSLVRENAQVAQGRLLRVAFLRSDTEILARTGIITSRRVGGAVVRNRVRRRLRELIRHTRAHFPPGSRIVVIAKPAASAASFEELQGEWLLLAGRLSIFSPPA